MSAPATTPATSTTEDHLTAHISAYAAQVVDQAPPLSPERLDRIVSVIRGGGHRG